MSKRVSDMQAEARADQLSRSLVSGTRASTALSMRGEQRRYKVFCLFHRLGWERPLDAGASVCRMFPLVAPVAVLVRANPLPASAQWQERLRHDYWSRSPSRRLPALQGRHCPWQYRVPPGGAAPGHSPHRRWPPYLLV